MHRSFKKLAGESCLSVLANGWLFHSGLPRWWECCSSSRCCICNREDESVETTIDEFDMTSLKSFECSEVAKTLLSYQELLAFNVISRRICMDRAKSLITVAGFLLIGFGAAAQQSSGPLASNGNASPTASNPSTVRGCLEGQRGSYILVEDKTGLVYALRGVSNKLDAQLNHEVEVKGRVRPGTIKTGVNPAKAGSNPSDTEHGVDGVPFQVANVQTDVLTISKHCKAADQE